MYLRSIAVAAVLLAAAFLLLPASAQEDAPPPQDSKLLAGKVAVVFVQNALPEDGIMIRNAEFAWLGGRWFLAGESPDIGDPEDWMGDTRVLVDWARVESFNLLTEEQFEERVKKGAAGMPNAL